MKAQGALLLGSAASNNPKVQIAALETDVISLLLDNINKYHDYTVSANYIKLIFIYLSWTLQIFI